MPGNNGDLSVEALVAVTGIFPKEPVTTADSYKATLLPGEWRTSVKEFFDTDKARRFKKTRLPMSYAKVSDLLISPDDNPDWLGTNFYDSDVANQYVMTVGNARMYLGERWPKLIIQAYPLPIPVDPGKTFIAEMGMLFTTLNNPSCVLDEMLSHSLQPAQVDAFSTVYPALYNMLLDFIDERKELELAKVKSWTVPWSKERILRNLFKIPVEAIIDEAPRSQAKMGSVTQVKIRPASESTKGQSLESKEIR